MVATPSLEELLTKNSMQKYQEVSHKTALWIYAQLETYFFAGKSLGQGLYFSARYFNY